MNIRHRLQQFDSSRVAIIEDNQPYTYGSLLIMMELWKKERWKCGSLVAINNRSRLIAIAKLFQALDTACIAIPMIEVRSPALWQVQSPLYDDLKKRQVPGVVLFTSGSSGEPKVAVHDASRLLAKWKIYDDFGWKPPVSQRYLCMLDFDHIGGINTVFHVLFNGGTLVFPATRNVTDVDFSLTSAAVNILPTSPSFLKMLLLKSTSNYPNLEMITYGTEPMPQSTLDGLKERWPHVRLKQTYGLTELGIMSTKSRDDGSTWLKLGGNGYEYRIVDDMLEIKAQSSMLGYLNAPAPYTDDGYYKTGDRVEVDGEWIRIIGRTSEFINVGGNKVHPTEIEDLLLKMPEIEDCLVTGESNPILGQIIVVTVNTNKSAKEIKLAIKDFMIAQSSPVWKIPQKVIVSDRPLYSHRLKKVRSNV